MTPRLTAAPAAVSQNKRFSVQELLTPNAPATFFYTCTPRLFKADLWTSTAAPPLLLAASSCWRASTRTLRTPAWPSTTALRFCDSGGFAFARRYCTFPFEASAYIAWLDAMQPHIAACLDLPCEEEIAGDDAEVARRQAWTLNQAERLLAHTKDWNWLPVVQGRSLAQYEAHARAYADRGLTQPLMGIGSLCRRRSIREIRAIVTTVAEVLPGVRFHLFGVALRLLTSRVALHPAIASVDSAAWNGRWGRDIRDFNAEMHSRQWTQDETAIQWALPRYQARVEDAQQHVKQHVLW